VAELRIPLSHPVLQHSGVIGCALRGQEVTGVKVTATQLVIYSQRCATASRADRTPGPREADPPTA
jgi:hypothetical protein